jgi:hypothetical protein
MRIAFKTFAGSNLGGDETSNRRLHAKPAAVGSGAWAWWVDNQADNLGTTYAPSTVPSLKNVDKCLEVCNDDEQCVAVIFTFAGSPPTSGAGGSTGVTDCTFRRGEVTTPTSGVDTTALRSMIRFRTDSADRVAITAA